MAKYVLEDMVRAKRARKEIPAKDEKVISLNPKLVRDTETDFVPVERPAPREIRREAPREVFEPVYASSSRKGGSRYALWIVAFLSVVFFGFAVSFLFSSATVTVTPRMETVELKENFSASSEPVGGNLFFDLVVISGEEKKALEATEEKDVALRAKGTAVIFNGWSASPQKLDIDTRLSGSNGKLYKTSSKITVPGMKSDGTPGSVEVGIYAAEAGEEYNSGPLDFQIVGFKGTPKYDKFQVRTKQGTEIKGGYKGKAAVVSDEEKKVAGAALREELRGNLTKKASEQIPPGFILFNDAVFLDASDEGVTTSYNDDKTLTLTQKGTLYGLLFNEQRLTKKIAEGVVDKYDGSDVYISNIKDLKFELIDPGTVSFSELKSLNFTLSGSANIVWKIDERKFAFSLLGQPKDKFMEILSKNPNIESAVLKVTPPWRRTIPEKKEEVKIIVDYPKKQE